MKNLKEAISFVVLFFTCALVTAQPSTYSTANAHSHNDYLNNKPLYRAYTNHFGSIEADIYPVNNILYVAHHKNEILPHHTLQRLYIKPLQKELAANNSRPLKLLIDIKENYKLSLNLLIQELEPLKQYLSTPQERKFLMIVISGTRPPPDEYKNYPIYFFFDDNFILKHSAEEWARIGLISRPFDKMFEWKGEGSMNRKEKKRIRGLIDSVHSAGKPFRFWGAPDTKTSWKLQKKLKADLIGTDKIDELAKFLL